MCGTLADQAKIILWVPLFRIFVTPKLCQTIRKHGSYLWGTQFSREEQINRYMINIYNIEKYVQYAIENTKKVTNLLVEIREIFTKEVTFFKDQRCASGKIFKP